MGAATRLLQRIVATRPMTWVYLNVFPHIDRRILRLTNGRLSVSVGQPVLLLTCIGAKSGQPRSAPLVYARDGEDVILIASNGGGARHPAWYHNLKAHPEVTLTLKGKSARYLAEEADGAERERLWRTAQRPNRVVESERTSQQRIVTYGETNHQELPGGHPACQIRASQTKTVGVTRQLDVLHHGYPLL